MVAAGNASLLAGETEAAETCFTAEKCGA
jgi:hypothetical protein